MTAQSFNLKQRTNLDINLLPEGEFEKTTFGKLIKWALSIGRYIIVFTEFIVILAFLSRFKFDRDITDIYELVDQRKTVVASAVGLEKNIRDLNNRLETINQINKNQKPYASLIAYFSGIIPEEVIIDNLYFTNDILSFSCQSQTPKGIGNLIYQLKNSPKLTNVSLGEVNQKAGQMIEFKVLATLTSDALKNEN